MKLALAKGCLWFFGVMIAILLLFPSHFEDKSTSETVTTLLFFGILAGGAAASWEWYQYEQEERKLRNAERRKGLDRSNRPGTSA